METWKFAINSVWSHKVRSFLTMLGIIIGVAAVVIIMSLGNGITALVTENATKAQEYTAIYYSPKKSGNLESYEVVSYDSDEDETTYTPPVVQEEWVKELTKIDGIDNYYLTNSGKADVSLGGKESKNVNLLGVNSTYFTARPIEILAGRALQSSDYTHFSKNTIIDENLSKKLFTSHEDALNQVVTIGKNAYRVIGVYRDKDSYAAPGSGGTAMMSNTALAAQTGGNLIDDSGIYVHITDTLNAQAVGIQAAKRLTELSHVQIGEFQIFDIQQQLDEALVLFNAITLVLGAIAGISLFVGGIGVMNIMLVSVTERTREIGLRKALGATRGKILTQFLIESIVLTLIGGLIGMLLAIGINAIISSLMQGSETFANMQLAITIGSATISILFSASIGIIFGLLPANKASKLDPIEALRYE